MTEERLPFKPIRVRSWLDQSMANGVAHEARCFVNVKFLHKPGPVRFSSFYTDPQVHGYVFRGLPLAN